ARSSWCACRWWIDRRRQQVAHVQEACEARHPVGTQSVVSIGDHAAQRRWFGTLRIAEAGADAEAKAVLAFHHQRPEHARVLAAPRRVPDHPGFGITIRLVLEQVAAAPGP